MMQAADRIAAFYVHTRRFRSTETSAYAPELRRCCATIRMTSRRLLPALPAAWTEGAVRGMRIRGGAVVDFSWKNGQVTACHMAGAAAEDAD